MSFPDIELRALSYAYGKASAVADVDLRIEHGELFGFLGLNGAGKTTALRLILGLLRPRAGEVRLFGQPAGRAAPDLRLRLGVLFEDFTAPSYLTGRQHLRLHGALYRQSGAALNAVVDAWLEKVGLAADADKKVRHYSMGMVRRLGVAGALLHSPELVLLDEPTNGLDPQGIHDLREIIQTVSREEGTTFFLSSHILSEVEKICQRVGIIHQGRLLHAGRVDELTGAAKKRCLLRVGDGEAAERVVAELNWCGGAALSEESVAGQRGVRLEVAIDEPDIPRLLRAVNDAGIDVFEARPVVKSLEDVFRETVAQA